MRQEEKNAFQGRLMYTFGIPKCPYFLNMSNDIFAVGDEN